METTNSADVAPPISTDLLTFDDWWSGKVFLQYATATFKAGEQAVPGKEWSDFRSDDVLLIKARQKELYEEEFNRRLAEWKDVFNTGFANSRMKRTYLDEQRVDLDNIMFGTIQSLGRVVFPNLGVSFDAMDLQHIQHYSKNVFKKGLVQEGYDFMHSPNCPYQKQGMTAGELYAELCWHYRQWLDQFEAETNAVMVEETVASTDFDAQIFSGAQSHLLFQSWMEEFKEDIKVKPLAYVSFIYGVMREYGFINDIKQSAYLTFIASSYGCSIDKLKTLQKCTTREKQRAFELHLKKFPALYAAVSVRSQNRTTSSPK